MLGRAHPQGLWKGLAGECLHSQLPDCLFLCVQIGEPAYSDGIALGVDIAIDI